MIPTYQNVKLIIKGPICYLVLHRPEKSNALNHRLITEIIDAAAWINSQDEICAVIIKGSGTVFSAGADLSLFTELNKSSTWSEKRKVAKMGKLLIDTIAQMKAITIAEVQSYAIGGAFLMVMACDFRYACDKAFFSIPELNIGIPLAWGGIPRMVRELGPLKTKELVLTCRKFSSEEAFDWGILNGIFPSDKLSSHCQKIAAELSEKALIPLQISKEQINSVADSMGNWGSEHSGAEILLSALSGEDFVKSSSAYLESIKEKTKK